MKNMAERRQDQLDTLMFKTMNGYAPVYMSSMFTKTTDVHTHGLRRTQILFHIYFISLFNHGISSSTIQMLFLGAVSLKYKYLHLLYYKTRY